MSLLRINLYNNFIIHLLSIVDRDSLLNAEGAYNLTSSASNFSVQIPLSIDDFELPETLTASLNFTVDEIPPRVTINPDSAEIMILDDSKICCNYDVLNIVSLNPT